MSSVPDQHDGQASAAKLSACCHQFGEQLGRGFAKLERYPWLQRLQQQVKPYRPLILILLLGILSGVAIANRSGQASIPQELAGAGSLSAFMGIVLLFFAAFKLFDWQGFATGFRRYDLLAARWGLYAKLYPLIELYLALLYLSNIAPVFTHVLTVLVMTISGAGVLNSLWLRKKRGEPALDCACLGTFFKLPLGAISLVENFGMALMALLALL